MPSAKSKSNPPKLPDRFNMRCDPELLRKAHLKAKKKGVTLTDVLKKRLLSFVGDK